MSTYFKRMAQVAVTLGLYAAVFILLQQACIFLGEYHAWLRWMAKGWMIWALPTVGTFYLGRFIPKDYGEIVCRIGKLAWEMNAFCRGWLITGKTGSGKTESGLNHIVHGLFQNATGSTRFSPTALRLKSTLSQLRDAYDKAASKITPQIKKLEEEIEELETKAWEITGSLADAAAQQLIRDNFETDVSTIEDEELARVLRGIQEKREDLGKALYQKHLLGERMIRANNAAKPALYSRFPWGGLMIDEKGVYYQTMESVAQHYEREHDLMLLQTRPVWADDSWRPTAKLNLLSDDRIPAATYAEVIVATAQALSSGGSEGNAFFPAQAKIHIEWSITLLRAIRDAQRQFGFSDDECAYPSLATSYEMLMSLEYYDELMLKYGVVPQKIQAVGPNGKNANIGEKPAWLKSPAITEALNHFERKFWNAAPDQRSGVQGTIQNYLAYFADHEVAEVFCSESTVSFDEMDKGRIWCVAMPPHKRVHRQFVQTILKKMFYQHAQSRFGLRKKDLETRNLLVLFQDEAQRFFGEEDGDTDTIRQAKVTTILISQGQPSLLAALHDKDKAKVTLSNLCNRLIFGSYSDECAKMSADFLKKKIIFERSYSSGGSGKSSSYSRKEVHMVPPSTLTVQKDFTAIVAHADKGFAKYILAPLGTDGKPTKWWPKACPYWWLKIPLYLHIRPLYVRLRLPRPG